LASNTLPCQAKILIKAAIDSLIGVPGAMMAVPLASPSGIGPKSRALNSSSSCCCDIWSSCFASKAIRVSLGHLPDTLRILSEVPSPDERSTCPIEMNQPHRGAHAQGDAMRL
jgi:hypothetical protein